MNIRQIINDSNSKSGRSFDLVIQALIMFSLISFCVETLPGLSQGAQRFLFWSELVTVAVFSAEYLLRLFLADSRLRFVFSFYGLIDLFAILPFYMSFGLIDLRAIRVLRLFRIFRALKLFRYSRALRLYRDAFREIKEELAVFFMATMFMLFISSVGIYYFESDAQPDAFKSVFHAMWWSVATLTTVGYGDVYPVTIGGRLFTFAILMLGLGIVAVPSGLIASALTRIRERIHEQQER